MAHYKILGGSPVWPVGASLRLVRERGGLRNVTPDERARLKFCKCSTGDIVDDVPAESVPTLVAQGIIELVSPPPRNVKRGPK